MEAWWAWQICVPDPAVRRRTAWVIPGLKPFASLLPEQRGQLPMPLPNSSSGGAGVAGAAWHFCPAEPGWLVGR